MENYSYKIKFSNTAFKDLERLEKKISEKVITGLKLFSRSPFYFKKDIKKLKGLGKNIYRLRIGEFRIIYSLSGLELIVLRIIDRKDLIKIIDSMKLK